ncbi:MAG: hypothetical protein RLZZ387_4007 [Chloroflexota bacterium]|jgi:hypothetical protein
MVTSLLSTAQRTLARGDLPRARVLLRTLAEQAPNDWQVWQALAEIAETDAERAEALARLAALVVPSGPRVTVRLNDEAIADQPPTAHRQPPTAHRPPPTAHRQELLTADEDEPWAAAALTAHAAPPPGWFRRHWLTYASLAVIALLLLGLAAIARDRLPPASAPQATPTPALPTMAPAGSGGVVADVPTVALPTLPPAEPTAALAEPTPAPTEPTAPPTAPATSPPATAAPAETTPSATTAPTAATSDEGLAIGQVVDRGDWSLTVLRPDHLLPLSGSVGGLAPQGRFVLALVAVTNRGTGAAPLPPDALALVDAQGQHYAPLPAASSAYLNAYQRGLRGDLSMEEPVPPDAGIVSIPVIFDVPEDATGLTLVVDSAETGWRLGQ